MEAREAEKLRAGERFQGVASCDAARHRQGRTRCDVCREGPERDGGPQAVAKEEERGERDARGRPDQRRKARHCVETKAEASRHKVRPRNQGGLAEVEKPRQTHAAGACRTRTSPSSDVLVAYSLAWRNWEERARRNLFPFLIPLER